MVDYNVRRDTYLKTGLILEGGAMRGIYTTGILDVLLENNIELDGAVGVSAGAAFGCNYKSRQIGRAYRYNLRFCRDRRYCGVYSLITTGDIFGADFCYNQIPLKYDVFDFEAYKNNPMEFYIVATDIETGEAVYRRFDDFDDGNFDFLRASASMPLVSQIVEIDGKKLLDGGVADSIPIRFFEETGYDRNIVILTRPKSYRKTENKMMPLVKMMYKKYPKLIEAMENRHRVYNETLDYIAEKEKRGEILVIRPESDLPIGKIEKNLEKIRETYIIGRKIATRRLEEIKAFLEK